MSDDRTVPSILLRIVGRVVDNWLTVGIFLDDVTSTTISPSGVTSGPIIDTHGPWGFVLLIFAFGLVVEIVPVVIWGVSVGKLLVGVRVIRWPDTPAQLRARLQSAVAVSMVKWLFWFGPLIAAFLLDLANPPMFQAIPGIIAILTRDQYGRSLHDRVTGTAVVVRSGQSRVEDRGSPID